MATTLGSKLVGDIVKIKENGVLEEYIIIHQGLPSDTYDATCNGTWVLRKNIFEVHQWDDTSVIIYPRSGIPSFLNRTFIPLFEKSLQNAMQQVDYPYYVPTTMVVLKPTVRAFLLSAYEVGFTTSNSPYIPVEGTKLAYFSSGTGTTANNKRQATLNGYTTGWWLRSPLNDKSDSVWFVKPDGRHGYDNCTASYGIRPAMILSPSLLVTNSDVVTTGKAPITPSSISVPDSIRGGTTITVSWGSSTDTNGDLSGYIVQRSINGGTWSQIYKGSSRSTTNAVAFGTTSVQYRVKAYDSEGLESDYRIGSKVTVLNNVAPGTPSSISVPERVDGGKPLTISWGSATDSDGNLSGYQLERQVDGGAWSQFYKGNALTYTDSITKGWGTVAYRVRAYDTYTEYSGYRTSPTRTVINNTAPTISSPSSGDLGTKTEGFAVSYTVEDADGDTLTVVETMDGATKRTYTPTNGAANSYDVTGAYFQSILNGPHTMAATVTDPGGKSAALSLTWTKAVHACEISLAQPMETDAAISMAVISVSRSIPDDATFQVLLTNNGKDPQPVWEDATNSVKVGLNYLFTNMLAANGFAFNFRVKASRGPSGQGGWIGSIGGAFQ